MILTIKDLNTGKPFEIDFDQLDLSQLKEDHDGDGNFYSYHGLYISTKKPDSLDSFRSRLMELFLFNIDENYTNHQVAQVMAQLSKKPETLILADLILSFPDREIVTDHSDAYSIN